MSLQFNKPSNNIRQHNNIAPQTSIPFAPIGFGGNGLPQPTRPRLSNNAQSPAIAIPGSNLKRALNYYADYGGCGFWRMIWPETLINAYQKAIINGLTTMVMDPRFYQGYNAVRLQRQASPIQLKFVEFLKHHQKEFGFKIIYEIDDIIFKDDIPDFNKCKEAFDNEEILKSAKEMMSMADEISVTCQYMKDYYIQHTSNPNITVIPNYTPKFWHAGLYNRNEISNNFSKNKKRPRVGYAGSGTHIDVTNKTNQNDDFAHVVEYIISTRKKFKWVFMGCYPLRCKPFIDNGEMEFHKWKMLYEYPRGLHDLKVNAFIAPLQPNVFNRAKSNIKYLEAGNLGIPCICQNLETYKCTPDELKFDKGNELIDKLDTLFKDSNTYMKYSDIVYNFAKTMQLDEHLNEYHELYFTPHGSPERKALLLNNP